VKTNYVLGLSVLASIKGVEEYVTFSRRVYHIVLRQEVLTFP